MPKITYIEHDGREHPVDVPLGLSVMRGAIDNNIPGIDADCFGECACATCHVYVDPEWLDKIEPQGQEERDILDSAFDVRANSRLSCQFTFKPELEGLHVTLSTDAAG